MTQVSPDSAETLAPASDPGLPRRATADMSPIAYGVGLALIVTLGFALRAYALGEFSLTHWDEGLAWRGAQWFASAGELGHYSPTHAPPLASLVFSMTSFLGDGPQVAVWASVLASCLGILAAARLARELAGRVAGLLAASCLAVSALHVMYARSLLTESLYSLFLLAMLASALAGLRTSRMRDFVFAGLVGAALQATKYNGFVAVGVVALFMLAQGRRRQAELRPLCVRTALVVGPTLLVMVLNLALIHLTGDLSAFFEHYGRYVGQAADAGDLVRSFTWLCVDPLTCTVAVIALILGMRRERARMALVAALLLAYVLFAARYALYLRLLLPIASLCLVMAGTAAGFVAERSRKTAIGLSAVVLLSLSQAWWSPPVPHALYSDFGGYANAEQSLGLTTRKELPLYATQAFVWSEAATQRAGHAAVVANPSGTKAAAFLEERGREPVLFLYDIGAFSRQRDWSLWDLHDRFREHASYRRL
ncbi:MAG: hypothetical protein ACI841_004507, partial [Planctomycetota bacterium]